MKAILVAIAALAGLTISACSDPVDGQASLPPRLPIQGNYTDSAGQPVRVTQYTWSAKGFTYSIASQDLGKQFVTVDSPTVGGPFYFVWTEAAGKLYICFTTDPSTPVTSDLSTGCLSGPWDALTPIL